MAAPPQVAAAAGGSGSAQNLNQNDAYIQFGQRFSRLPYELQLMALKCRVQDVMVNRVARGAHWFRYLRHPNPDFNRNCTEEQMRDYQRRESILWLPWGECSFATEFRLFWMLKPAAWYPGYVPAGTPAPVAPGPPCTTFDHIPEPWPRRYFFPNQPSAYQLRRDLIRTHKDGMREVDKIVTAVEDGQDDTTFVSTFVSTAVPTQHQLAYFDGLPVDHGVEALSHMIIDVAQDILIFQAPDLLARAGEAPEYVATLRQALVSGVYPRLSATRFVGFECPPYGDDEPPKFPDRDEWPACWWAVVHFPCLEEVFLVDYSIAPRAGFVPDPKTARFQGNGLDLYEVDETVDSAQRWLVPSTIFEKAKCWRRNIVSHHEAWVQSRLNQNLHVLDPRRVGMGARLPGPGGRVLPFSVLTARWFEWYPGEPRYWSDLGPYTPMTPIPIKVLAAYRPPPAGR